MVEIPFDVVTEILSWVPTRSLFRFRCVGRFWYALLHESGFMKLHLLRANQTNPTLSILYNPTNENIYCVDLATSNEPLKLENLSFSNFYSSCNGLVCISDQRNSITLWNPTMREYKELPPPFVNSTALNYFRVIGFGWDPMKDDFKVLAGQLNWKIEDNELVVHAIRTNSWREICQPSLMVYTLRTNSWREISQSTFPLWHFLIYRRSTFFKGGLHWLMKTIDFTSHMLIYFEMAKEVFKEIHLPEYKNEAGETGNVSMGVLQECLCVSVARKNISQEQMDIWIMRRYGVEEESWSKKFCIERSHVTRQIFESPMIQPVSFQKSKLVLAVWSGLISYNTESGSVEYVKICGTTWNWSYLGSHVETLVSLKAF